MIVNELKMPSNLAQQLLDVSRTIGLEDIEKRLLDLEWGTFDFIYTSDWQKFANQVLRAWDNGSAIIIRGIPTDDGGTTLLASLCLSSRFKPYKENKIVKHFKMTPWTKELSQTIQEGYFHTDINTSLEPPSVTIIHCHRPDPAPGMGESRVVLLSNLLDEIRRRGETKTLTFLMETKVDIVNVRKNSYWTGTIVEGNNIRFHPESLRAAALRLGSLPPELECYLAVIHDCAMSVSKPIHLASGDALLVSNKRALHYRGKSTVSFNRFPQNFLSREVYVLHLQDEPRYKHDIKYNQGSWR